MRLRPDRAGWDGEKEDCIAGTATPIAKRITVTVLGVKVGVTMPGTAGGVCQPFLNIM